jgi:hypothetical protein
MSSGMCWRVAGQVVIDITKNHSAFAFKAQAFQGKWPALQLAVPFGLLHPLRCRHYVGLRCQEIFIH